MSALKPDAVDTHELGTTALPWKNLHIDAVTVGARADGANVPTGTEVTIGSNAKLTADPSVPVDVEIYGSLTVHGATTTISSTTLTISDKEIIVAQGAANSAAADGAGLRVNASNDTLGAADATLLYDDTGTQWEFNKNVETAGSLLPETTGQANFNLGAVAQPWNDLFLSSAGVINFANTEDPIDGSDLTLTHSAGALTLSSTGKLQFQDNGTYINSSADGQLDLSSDGAGESALKLAASAGGVDIDAAATKDVNIAGGQVALVSKDNATSAISLTANVGVTETIVVTNTKGTAENAITLVATAGGVDIDASQGKDVNIAGGQVALVSKANADNTGLASAISLTTPAGAPGGAADTIVVTNTQGTEEDAITLTATAGGVDIDAAAAKDVNIAGGQVALVSKDNAASAISLTANVGTDETIAVTNTQGTGENAIALTATAGGLDLDAAAAKDVNIAGGQVALVSKDNAASAISLTTNQGTSETIVVTNTQGEGTGAITLTSTAGGIDINAAADKDVDIAGGQVLLTSSHDTASAIYLRANAGTSETIKVHADQGTSESSIQLLSDAGGVDIDAAQGKDVNIAGGQVTLVSKANADNTGLASAISLTTPAGAPGGAADTIVVTNTQGTEEGAIALTSTAGGVDIDAAAAKDVNIAGGQVALVSKDDAASAISLTTNQGTTETIVVTNTQGTDNAAIALTATVGGITATVADGKELTLGNAQSDAYFKVAAHGTAGNEDVRVVNTNGTDEAAIAITASAGGVDIDAAATKDVNIAGGQVALVSKDDAASAISLTANQGTSETIVVTNTQGTAEGAITLTSTAGGVNINAAAGKDVDISGGQVLLTSEHDTASAIYLRANAGTSETIKVHADQGTSESSIQLLSDAGGVDIDAAAAKDVNIAGGQVALVSKDDAASAISLTTDQGTSETIVVTNTQGTASGAIALTASAGGIALTSAGSVVVDSDAFDITSDQANDPLVRIVNTANDANGARLQFVKDKGAAGAADDVAGLIEFIADDANQDQVKFGEIKSQVAVHTDGQEGGKLTFSVASHDGELQPGLILTDGDAEDEIDVTIGSGSSSLTTVSGGLTVTGGLTVNGTTTTVSTTDLEVTDKQILIAKGNDSLANANNSGLYIDVTGGTDLHWRYVNGTTSFTANTSIDLDTNGSVYKIEGTEVIGANGAKKVHSDVAGNATATGLTHSGGVLSVSVNGLTELASATMHQTEDSVMISDNGTTKKISFSNFEDSIFANISGDATVADGGALTIAAGAVEHGMLAEDIISGQAELAKAHIADADDLMIHDATASAVKKVGVDSLRDYFFSDISGDATVADGGALTIAAAAVHGSMLNTDAISGQSAEHTGVIDDTDEFLISDAGTLKKTDFSVLRDAVFADVSGDATVADGGALTIAAGSVEHGMLAEDIISGQAELAHNSIADADDLMIHDTDAAVVKKVGVDSLRDHFFDAISGDATVAGGGALTIATDAVENSMILNDHLTLAADSGGNVDLHLGDTFTIAGTSGEIETTVTADTITVGLPDNVDVDGTLTVAGIVTLSANTASTNSTTGALKVAGGLGVVGNVNTGASINSSATSGQSIFGSDADTGFVLDHDSEILKLADRSLEIHKAGGAGSVFTVASNTGNTVIKGTTQLGDAVGDTVTCNGRARIVNEIQYAEATVSISGGTIAADKTYMILSSEQGVGSDAADSLTSITGGVSGQIIVLQATSGHTITIENEDGGAGTNKLYLNDQNSFVMNSVGDTLQCIYRQGVGWCEIGRSAN